MKYLMGLILSFSVGAAAIAQDNKNDDCEGATSSAKFRQEKNTNLSGEGQTNDESEVMYGESGQDFTKMERIGENGSVYYFNDPSIDEESTETKPTESSAYSTEEFNEDLTSDEGMEESSDMNASADAETEAAGKTDARTNAAIEGVEEGAEKEMKTETESKTLDAEATSKSGVLEFGNTCMLNGLLDDNAQGKYKYKEDLENGAELKVEKESDGDGQVKYESDNEYYDYKKNEKGETEYYHGVANENETAEVYKNKDGSVDVFYQGHFNNMDEARSLEKGSRFEGIESVCNQ